MTQIIQDFMAFQIHITHLEQAVVCANEKISDYLSEVKGDVEPQYYKKFHALSNFLLLLYDIHGVRSSDVISFCTKIWRRIVDCQQELKAKGKLRVFITAANGCLVTIVKAIDAISMLKSLWKNLALKIDERDIKLDEDWISLDKLINEHIEDATEKLEAVDMEIQLTRQKVLNIKKPSIRILEVAQMDVDGEMIYMTEQPVEDKKKGNDMEVLKNVDLVPNIIEKNLKKSSTVELGEIVEDELPTIVTTQTNTISIQAKPSKPTPTSIQTTLHELSPLQIPVPTTQTNNFQQTPSLAYPTMSALPMQAQLIPTIQMDAFGNQSVVYQLAYHQVTPTMSSNLTSQGVPNPLNTSLAGIVLPGYNPNGSPFQAPNHQASPTLLATNTSQELHPQQENTNIQVPLHYATLVEDRGDDQVIVVKAEPGEYENEAVKIKEESDGQLVTTMIKDDMSPYIKQEPEWNEEVDKQ